MKHSPHEKRQLIVFGLVRYAFTGKISHEMGLERMPLVVARIRI